MRGEKQIAASGMRVLARPAPGSALRLDSALGLFWHRRRHLDPESNLGRAVLHLHPFHRSGSSRAEGKPGCASRVGLGGEGRCQFSLALLPDKELFKFNPRSISFPGIGTRLVTIQFFICQEIPCCPPESARLGFTTGVFNKLYFYVFRWELLLFPEGRVQLWVAWGTMKTKTDFLVGLFAAPFPGVCLSLGRA